jgi:hypothetical protein
MFYFYTFLLLGLAICGKTVNAQQIELTLPEIQGSDTGGANILGYDL